MLYMYGKFLRKCGMANENNVDQLHVKRSVNFNVRHINTNATAKQKSKYLHLINFEF